MSQIKNLGITINTDAIHHSKKSIALRFIEFLQEFKIDEIEKLLDEDFKDSLNLNKYENLAAIKAVLQKFKEEGDTELTLNQGKCKIKNNRCSKANSDIYQLIGNNSGHTFDFGIDEKKGEITEIYSCMYFYDKHGNKSKNYHTMFVTYALKLADFMKKNKE